MLPLTSFFLLFTASLLAFPDSRPAKPLDAAIALERLRKNVSSDSPQMSTGDKYSLRGTVVNSVTGEAIRGALVQVYFNGQSSLLTGPDGKFQFDGLPAGSSTINVRKPGFFPEEEIEPGLRGQRQATTGPDAPPVIIKLVPEGVIYGRISEENGEPVEGLPIMLLEQSLQNGRKTWQQRQGAQTDEEGNFRIAELPPNNYFLSAGPSRNPVTLPSELSQPGAQGIPLVYYPAGADLSAAAPISITPGKKMEINLSIPSQPFYRVSGTVSGYAPGQSVFLQLHNSVGMMLPYNWRFDSAAGTFRIPWIPAGSYMLLVQASDSQGHSLTATVPLTVKAELSGIHLNLLPAVNIPISMRVISSHTDTERFSGQENYFPAYVQLGARHGDMLEARYGAQQVGERGATSLELQNIAPGTYTVEINPNGPLYVQSATSGITNLLDSELSVAPGSSPQPIEIILRDDVASLSGSVSFNNQSVSAVVLAISEHPSVPPRIQSTDPSGGFQLPFLPPGAYKIIAVDHPDRIEYANPDVLSKYLSKARDVTLSPDQSAKLDLELTKVGE
jgi:hypothetical protein